MWTSDAERGYGFTDVGLGEGMLANLYYTVFGANQTGSDARRTNTLQSLG